MVLMKFFFRNKKLTTANTAKERLQIIVAERNINNKYELHHIPQLKNDLIQVIRKYLHEPQITSIQLKKKDKSTSILKFDVFFYNKKI